MDKTEAARKILLNDESPAEAVYEAADHLLSGPKYAIDAWDSDTVQLELAKKKIELSEMNLSKVRCCVGLKANAGVPFVGSTTLKNVCCIFNNELPDLESEEEMEVEHLAWGIKAINLFLKDREIYFDYGPIDYIADILHMEGYVLAPDSLHFVQEYLSKRNSNLEMEDQVRQALSGQEKNYNDAVRGQVIKHARVIAYVSKMEGFRLGVLSHI